MVDGMIYSAVNIMKIFKTLPLLLPLGLTLPTQASNQVSLTLDGQLTEPEWQQAVRYRQFYQMSPETLQQRDDLVDARVLTTDAGLYIGIINHQSASERKKQYNLPDGFIQADFNRIYVDFSGDGSAGFIFVPALGGGVQDAVLTPKLSSDYDWDGVWEYQYAEFDDYWSVEVFIPWHSVSFKPNRDENGLAKIGVSVQLYELATNKIYASQPQLIDNRNFYSSMPTISADIPDANMWGFVPYVSAINNQLNDQLDTETGFNFFYKPKHNQKLSVAVNPDFGQVDSDNIDVNYSSVETLQTDKRPFFTEDIGFFDLALEKNTKLIHTRRIGAGADDGSQPITAIDVAARFMHQGDNLHIGGFAVQEESLEQNIGKEFYAGRLKYYADSWQSGLLMTQTQRPFYDKTARTLAWDSQYQTDKFSLRAALLATDVSGDESTRGQGVSINSRYEWNSSVNINGRFLQLSDDFDNLDLGYIQRNDWRYSQIQFNYNQLFDNQLVNRVQHSFLTSYETNTNGLTLPSQHEYFVNVNFTNGASAFGQYIYKSSGYDDQIGGGLGIYRADDKHLLKAFYGSSYTGKFSWAVSFQFDQEGIDGNTRQFALDTTYMPNEYINIKFNNFYREGDGWLIGLTPGVIGQFDRQYFVNSTQINGLITDNLEASFSFQYSVLDALDIGQYDIQAADVRLLEDATDSSFEDHRFVSQFKLRYRLGAYSDVYLVYNRGGTHIERSQQNMLHAKTLTSLWQHRDQDTLTFKVRYLF